MESCDWWQRLWLWLQLLLTVAVAMAVTGAMARPIQSHGRPRMAQGTQTPRQTKRTERLAKSTKQKFGKTKMPIFVRFYYGDNARSRRRPTETIDRHLLCVCCLLVFPLLFCRCRKSFGYFGLPRCFAATTDVVAVVASCTRNVRQTSRIGVQKNQMVRVAVGS